MDALNRRDRAAWLALCDPEVEDITPWDWPESEPTRGHEAIWDLYAVFDYSEFIDAGRNRLLAHLRARSWGSERRPRHVGLMAVGTFRDEKVLRIEWFADRAEVLVAAGLAE
jgi:ketosteroid isomerase-like protein